MRYFVRALFAPSLLVLTLSAGMLVPNAANAGHGQSTERSGSRWTSVWDEDGTRAPRVRLAKAVYSDSDAWDDEDVRPRRRYRRKMLAHQKLRLNRHKVHVIAQAHRRRRSIRVQLQQSRQQTPVNPIRRPERHCR